MGSQQSLYSRLKHATREIRLIHIQPGVWDDPILCEIQVVSLDSSPSPVYQTLSYTWGDSQATKPILLEDCVVDVKANLWAALRRLRCASKARVIWIDALSINQDDIPERNQQVMLMGKIYSSCGEVIMWLGDSLDGNTVDTLTVEEGAKASTPGKDTPKRSQVFDAFFVVHLLGGVLGRDSHFNQLPFFHHLTRHGMAETPKVARFRKAWKLLESIMKLPYWDRIWIVQENILPPSATVALGSMTMSWFYFSQASKALTEAFKHLLVVSGLDQLRTFKQFPPLDLGDLLHQFFHRKATDPRDKVYGLMSLIDAWSNEIWKNRKSSSIIPDYSPSNSPRRMFLRVTIYLLEERKSLKILTGFCQRRHEPDYPSWVVDWGLDPDISKWDVDRLRMQMYDHYNAAKEAPFVAKGLSNERLKVQGLFVDEVSAVGPYISSPKWDSSFPTLDSVLLLDGKRRIATDGYKGGGTWAEAHWRTICGNLIHEDEDFRKATPEDRVTCVRYQAVYVHGYRGFLKTREDEESLNQTHISVTGALGERRVFVTKDGYLGLGPVDMKIGDQVFTLSGSNVPFLLRAFDNERTDSFQTQYRLVGDSYVHGIMDGETYESSWFDDPRYLILH